MQAQTGCEDSPENPTFVFGLITGAASFGLVHFRNRKGSRSRQINTDYTDKSKEHEAFPLE